MSTASKTPVIPPLYPTTSGAGSRPPSSSNSINNKGTQPPQPLPQPPTLSSLPPRSNSGSSRASQRSHHSSARNSIQGGSVQGGSVGSRSITSTEAINKLKELEALLERERTARLTAEKTLQSLREERKAREEAEKQKLATEKQMQLILQSLQELIGQPVDIKQLNRLKKQVFNADQQQQLQNRLAPRSFLDAIGEHELEGSTIPGNHERSAKRTANATDHRGYLHFRLPPSQEGAGVSREATPGRARSGSRQGSLPPPTPPK
eukprot:PhF_6_TR14148/c1_g1_i1/m.22632